MLKQLLSRIRSEKTSDRDRNDDFHLSVVRNFGNDIALPVGCSIAYDPTAVGTIFDASGEAVAQFHISTGPAAIGGELATGIVVSRYSDGEDEFFTKDRIAAVAEFSLGTEPPTLKN